VLQNIGIGLSAMKNNNISVGPKNLIDRALSETQSNLASSLAQPTI